MSTIVLDTSTLLNFALVERFDLLYAHSYNYVVTDYVGAEITNEQQKKMYTDALASKTFRELSTASGEVNSIFSYFKDARQLGDGESSAIAIASSHSYILAIDDKIAIRTAQKFDKNLTVFRTQDLIVLMIQENLLDVTEADSIKAEWARYHKFILPFSSFQDLIVRTEN